MKKYAAIGLVLLCLSSCTKQYIQVFETATTNTVVKDGLYVFENDSIRVSYAFWAEQGVMAFSIFNKLSRPIYVDWKNSSFIYNEKKLNYWADEQKMETTGTFSDDIYTGCLYRGPLLSVLAMASTSGTMSSSSLTTKPERVTFIPPKSSYDRSQFLLLPVDSYVFPNNHPKQVVPRVDNPKKKVEILSQQFDQQNSPMRFRNFLSYSLGETSTSFSFVDNEFWLASVKDMDYIQF
ncbi:MAG: hypothetical protein H7330_00655, partial [Hymenobacteraceae bacterium]|nr:hypothetical protein [Hymenobacteraceae bacterium]